MRKTIIQRIVFLLVFTANVLFANAQAYEFVCKESTRYEGSWTCGLKNSIDVQKDLEISFHLDCCEDCYWNITWYIYDNRGDEKQFDEDADMNIQSQVVVYLENGYTVTFRDCISSSDYLSLWDDRLMYITNPRAEMYLNGKRFMFNDVQRQNFVMSLFRVLNITKISFDGKMINMPDKRTAETFNAMCKALAAKTGNVSVYGKEGMEKSLYEEVDSKFSVKPSAGTTNRNATPNTTPAVTKQMTEMQMVMYPFGILTKNKGTYTNQQVKTELTAMFKDNVIVMDSMALVSRGDGEGYDYSYKGGYPVCTGFFNDVKLSSWSYYFDLDKASYTQSTIITLARNFMDQLRYNNFQLVGGIPSDDELYNSKLRGFGREVEIIVKETSGDNWRLLVSVRYKK